MKLLPDGKIECDAGHKHTDMSPAIWCAGTHAAEKLQGRERLVIPQKQKVEYDGLTYLLCPAGHLHDVGTFPVVVCDRYKKGKHVLAMVSQEVEHDGQDWVACYCRHLHAPEEVVGAIYCRHYEGRPVKIGEVSRESPNLEPAE